MALIPRVKLTFVISIVKFILNHNLVLFLSNLNTLLENKKETNFDLMLFWVGIRSIH